MRTLTQSFITEKNKATSRPIRLFAVSGGILGATILRYAEWAENVTYNTYLYYAFPIRVEEIAENINAEVESVKVVLSSVNQEIIAWLENYDGLRKWQVIIRTVFADLLSDATAYTDDILYVASCNLTEKEASFILKSKLDVMGVLLPLRRYYRLTCQWRFKSSECGYALTANSCTHIMARCKELGNLERFGGFPGTGAAIRKIYI